MPTEVFYDGEFGSEIILFLPYVTWLSEAGLLQNTDILTFSGMSIFYESLKCRSIIERDQRRHGKRHGTVMPVRLEHTYRNPSPFHLFPLMRKLGTINIESFSDAFAESLKHKPILIVHNKYNNEWKGGPVNFINAECLRATFDRLRDMYTIVYIRHGIRRNIKGGFAKDARLLSSFDDSAILADYPDIFLFDKLFDEYTAKFGDASLNNFKLSIYRKCFHFISAQGGGAHQCAYYDGSLLTVLHKMGREIELAYAEGYYSFLANPAPSRIICLNEDEYIRSLCLYDDPTIINGVAQVPARYMHQAQEFSPWSARARWEGPTVRGHAFAVPKEISASPTSAWWPVG